MADWNQPGSAQFTNVPGGYTPSRFSTPGSWLPGMIPPGTDSQMPGRGPYASSPQAQNYVPLAPAVAMPAAYQGSRPPYSDQYMTSVPHDYAPGLHERHGTFRNNSK